MLAVEGLTKTFGARCVLSDVSFNIGAGEVLGLIGPNGAGKTTVEASRKTRARSTDLVTKNSSTT